jgi:hypothetical protein
LSRHWQSGTLGGVVSGTVGLMLFKSSVRIHSDLDIKSI